MCVSMVGYAQEEQNAQESTPNITEAERIIDKYGGKIVDGFNSFVEKATPYAEEGFKMVVRLQIAKGIGLLLPLFITIFSWFLLFREVERVRNLESTNSYGPWDSSNITVQIIIYLIVGMVSSMLAFVTTYDGILHLMAPEWYAIQELIELIN